MTYQQLIEELHSSNPNPRYYHLLLENAHTVVWQVTFSSQAIVATDLNMTAPAFNTLYKVLKEYANTDSSSSIDSEANIDSTTNKSIA